MRDIGSSRVQAWLLPCLFVLIAPGIDWTHVNDVTESPKPCCLPYKFQAVVTSIGNFNVNDKQVTRLYRDWEARLQVQQTVLYNAQGIERTTLTVLADYGQNKWYVIQDDGKCAVSDINYGMLEPCMPDDAIFVGRSYVGSYENQARYETWNFRRTDYNRNIEMTIMVTADRCVPMMEQITGTLGTGKADTLVLFSNFTRVKDESVFQVPASCSVGNTM